MSIKISRDIVKIVGRCMSCSTNVNEITVFVIKIQGSKEEIKLRLCKLCLGELNAIADKYLYL